MNQQNNDNGFGKYVMSFFTGMIVGGLVTYFTAPRSGEETRNEILSRTSALQDSAEQTADETLKSMRMAVKDMNSIAEEFRNQSQTALNESKEQWAQSANEIKQAAIEAIEESRVAASEAIDITKKAAMEEV
ncbi:MAG: YtxH domain-containing protein [Candidatus Promineifilaceae bacterium]|jgi:gas vesicle protein